MSSFAEFARDIVERQVAYYERVGGEYNQDPFSVRYRTEMIVERVFAIPDPDPNPGPGPGPVSSPSPSPSSIAISIPSIDFESKTGPEPEPEPEPEPKPKPEPKTNHTTSLETSRKLDTLAIQYETSLALEERRHRELFQKHRDALAITEHELAEFRSAEETADPVLTALSSHPATKRALLEYRRYGLDRLRYVNRVGVLAILDSSTGVWFFPRRLPIRVVRLDPSLFSIGDAVGSLEEDNKCHPSHVPDDMKIPNDKDPVWWTHLCTFYAPDLLNHTPWVCHHEMVTTTTTTTRSQALSDFGRELVHAMVVTRQVATFFGQGEGAYPSSYGLVDRLHAAFRRHVKAQFVDPALEAIHRRFQGIDWSNLYVTVLRHLPVFRRRENWCDDDDRDIVADDEAQAEETDECLFTGRTRDLVGVTVIRCLVLEWDHDERFENHIRQFTAKYARGLQRWWYTCKYGDDGGVLDRQPRLFGRSRHRRRFVNSRQRGRMMRHDHHKEKEDEEEKEKDYDGFLIGPWTDRVFLHRDVANLLVHAWRLTHLDWWIDAILLQWRRDKSSFHPTNEEVIQFVTDAIMLALWQCQTQTGTLK